MQVPFYTADVFTDRLFGGNPLAVVPDGAALNDTQMQLLAREFNLSETTFVLPADSAEHTFKVRIFTPRVELPFAGHPTIGTAYVLATIGAVPVADGRSEIILEQGLGPVRVAIRAEQGRVVSAQLQAPRPVEIGVQSFDVADLAAMISLDASDLDPSWPPLAASCGVPFVFVSVASLAAMRRARLRRDLWERRLAGGWADSIYLICSETANSSADLHARMFAPSMGIDEDPATGAAATALAGLLAARSDGADGSWTWIIEQGMEMGRPSLLEIEADKTSGVVTAIRLAGRSVMISAGTLRVSA